jgi:hypothetical protein
MSNVSIPVEQWKEFLDSFSERHRCWLVRIEIHDVETEENVASEFMPLHRIELDTEDPKNPRINVTVGSELKSIKHVFFRPTHVSVHLSADGTDEWLTVQSLNTSTTIRLRMAVRPEIVDGVA